MDPALLLAQIERLPDNSMTAALATGGRQFFGWGLDRSLAADTYDAVNINTIATGNFKKRPSVAPYPRPMGGKRRRPGTGAHKSGPGEQKQVNLRQLHQQLLAASAKNNK